jgi:diaminopimelate decarboxylase
MSWVPKAMKAVAQERILDADLASPIAFGDVAPSQTSTNNDRTHCFVVSADELRYTSHALHDAFEAVLEKPESWSSLRGGSRSQQLQHPFILHSFAAKANPLQGVLAFAAKECALGCETASIGEFAMAQRAGYPLENIVFDSPVKTNAELKYVIAQGQGAAEKAQGGGAFVNVDNFEELDRVANIFSGLGSDAPHNTTIGLRINPQLGQGSIGQLSTALATSKFGIGLHDAKAEIMAAFKNHPTFVKMLHVHTGSQGIGLKMMVAGVKAIVDLAEEINSVEGGGRCTVIDIGGGLPVNFTSDEYTPTFASYVEALKEGVPALFSGKYSIITEFGRSLVAKAGVLASRVEYVKVNGGRRIVQQHIGADLAIRTVWQPENWKLRVDVYNLYAASTPSAPREPTGVLRELDESTDVKTDVAGPCCLGGDLMCVDRPLPATILPLDDCIVLKDVGGYYHSSFSHYNLRSAPPCYLHHEEGNRLEVVHRGDSIDTAHGPYLLHQA